MEMKTPNHGTIFERSLHWMFKAYLASYLVLEEAKVKKHERKIQKAVR